MRRTLKHNILKRDANRGLKILFPAEPSVFLDLESTEAAALDSFYVSAAINDVVFFFQPVWKRDRSRVCASCPSVVSEMAHFRGECLCVSTAIQVFDGLPSLP